MCARGISMLCLHLKKTTCCGPLKSPHFVVFYKSKVDSVNSVTAIGSVIFCHQYSMSFYEAMLKLQYLRYFRILSVANALLLQSELTHRHDCLSWLVIDVWAQSIQRLTVHVLSSCLSWLKDCQRQLIPFLNLYKTLPNHPLYSFLIPCSPGPCAGVYLKVIYNLL